jgi:hypothetical protein
MGTQPSPLCNPVISWGIPIAASIILPTLIFAVLSPRWTATRLHHCILGTGSVFATVLVTFGIWRLIHNIPLLSNGYRFLIENFLMVAVAGLILSPVGWILGSWLPTRAAPAQASDE